MTFAGALGLPSAEVMEAHARDMEDEGHGKLGEFHRVQFWRLCQKPNAVFDAIKSCIARPRRATSVAWARYAAPFQEWDPAFGAGSREGEGEGGDARLTRGQARFTDGEFGVPTWGAWKLA